MTAFINKKPDALVIQIIALQTVQYITGLYIKMH